MDVSELLSSRARYRILDVFSRTEERLGVRTIEALTGLAIGSVQLAVRSLVMEGLLETGAGRGRTVYQKNKKAPVWAVLREIFEATRVIVLKHQSALLSKRAKEAIRLSQDLHKLLSRARAWTS